MLLISVHLYKFARQSDKISTFVLEISWGDQLFDPPMPFVKGTLWNDEEISGAQSPGDAKAKGVLCLESKGLDPRRRKDAWD